MKIDNPILKISGDFDGDGFQEVYWKTNDNTAPKIMHADGNIQYANYQNEAQMSDYLTSKGFENFMRCYLICNLNLKIQNFLIINTSKNQYLLY